MEHNTRTVRDAVGRPAPLTASASASHALTDAVFDVAGLTVSYAGVPAIRDVTLPIPRNRITAFIGPSGCGKSTLLRAFNRMNDLIPGARIDGSVRFNGEDIYGADVDPVEVRRRIGMVFQKPNPFPKSIYDNVAFGPRLNGQKKGLDDVVEASLRATALWDEVKGKLKASGLALSGGQQQRLCMARAIATNPEVILMDEPCSALDPIATLRIEELMRELAETYSLIVVTHNMQQASRVSDHTAFFSVDIDDVDGARTGELIEFNDTQTVFTGANDQRTEDYVTGRFG